MTTVTTAVVPRASAAPAAERPPSPFIVSPAYDGLFFFGSALAVVLAWIASSGFHVASYYVLVTVAVVSNGPHLASTWTRVYLDDREWRARPIHLVLVPLLITAAVAGATLTMGYPGQRLLNTVILYWAVWHFVAQCWGLLRIYQRRSGEPERSVALRLERPLLMTFVGWCLLHRVVTGPRRLFGTEIHYPAVPPVVVDVLLWISIALCAAWIVLRVHERATPWAASAWIRGAFLASAGVGFFVPFVLITRDSTAAFAAAAGWHGLQYIGIVHFYHRNAWRGGVHPRARIISYVSQPGWQRAVLYGALLLALAGAALFLVHAGASLTQGTRWSLTTWFTVVWSSLTLSHYYVDGVIWKLSKDSTLARRLALSSGRDAVA